MTRRDGTFLARVIVQAGHSIEEYIGLWPVRRGWSAAIGLMALWVGIGLVNGIGHPVWTLTLHRYTSGVATAPVLLVLALFLGRQLVHPAMRPRTA